VDSTEAAERLERIVSERRERLSSPRVRNADRHVAEASADLQSLFSGALPGLASPADVEGDAFMAGYRPHERLLVSEWADRHRVLEGAGASEPGPWRTSRTPYMREIMDNMSSKSPVWMQSLVAGAQVSKTESANNCVGYWASSAPGPTMYVLPKVGTAKTVSDQRITPMFKNTDVISKRLLKDLLLKKVFVGGMLLFASAQSAADLKSTPIQYLVMDEVDEYPLDIGGQGSPVDLAIARTRTFRNKRKILLTSTTTAEATSQIWKHWLAGDMRLYHMPCPHCREMIVFEFAFEGGKGGLKWEWGKPKTVYYECQECGGKIYEADKTAMLEAGEWRPTRKDLSEVEEGVRSYRLPSLYSPVGWLGWDEIAEKWEGCYQSPTGVAEFRNTVLALPSIEVSQKVDWETVYTRGDVGEEPYDMGTVPDGVLFLTAGADVGQDHVEIGVWGWGRDQKRWLIEHFRIDGSVHDQATWTQVSDAVHRTYRNKAGVEFGIRKFFIDTSAWPELVKPWIRTQNQHVVMGVDGLDHLDQPVKVEVQAEPIASRPGKKTRVGALSIAFVGVSFLKAELVGALSIPRPDVPTEAPYGWVHMPKQGLTVDMAKQLTSERKVTERDGNGRITGYKWVRIEGRRAEVLDCHNYARAGAALVGWDRFRDPDFERLENEIAAAEAELREAAAAAKRGTPLPRPPAAQVGVIAPKKGVTVVAPGGTTEPQAAKAVQAQQKTGVTIIGQTKPVVPLPKVLSEA